MVGINRNQTVITCAILLVFLRHIRSSLEQSQPHILFILADDYGFNDIGYHGSEILTPNLDALAAEGVKLENYYVQPVCTPTRSQLMTGRYQIHTGMQHGVIDNAQQRALPLNSQILPERIKDVGYTTHMIGKWHLGFFNDSVIPTSRGFDTFYGFYGSDETYFTHIAYKGYDFRDGTAVDCTASGTYSTHLFAQRAIDIVSRHDPHEPMFMYLAFQTPHVPLEVPSSYEEPYDGIVTDSNRKTYAGMVTCMDEAIGNVTAAFQQYGLWDNTVLIFSTDNGGLENKGGADNFPLRGGKGNLWEGGIRGVAFVRSSHITGGVENNELIHVSDWFPTIINLASGSYKGVLDLDGYDQWDTISGSSPSPRTELLHNIDPIFEASGTSSYNSSYFDTSCRAAIRKGDWKLITGDPGVGRLFCPAGAVTGGVILLSEGIDDCAERRMYTQNVWLFNIAADPYEETDLSSDPAYESVILELLERLKYYNSTAVEAYFPDEDPRSLPWHNGGVWGPWL